jgi:hypothetical protein
MSDSVEELEEQLGRWASGSRGVEAAVELLIETGFWLSRAEFIERALRAADGGVAIDWDAASVVATDVQCSRGERFLLQLACSFADPQKAVAMSEVSTLDGRNLKRVIEATETAKFGWR